MQYVLASSPLAAAGQTAAIILVIEMFIFILVGLVLSLVLMFAFTWVRGKAELIKKVRPTVDSINMQTELATKGTPPSVYSQENKIIRVVEEIPARLNAVEEKVEQGSERVADVVIEFRARTVMVQTVLKGFFLPGLKKREERNRNLLIEKGPGYKSPGLQRLLEEHAPEVKVSAEAGNGYVQRVGVAQIKDASTY